MEDEYLHQFLGSYLIDARSKLGLRQTDVAAMCDLSTSTVRQVEAGGGTISSFLTIAHQFDLRLSWAGLSIDDDPGRKLAEHRSAMAISQRELAKRIGVVQRTIVNLEHNFSGRVETLERYLTEVKMRSRLVSVKGAASHIRQLDWQSQFQKFWSGSDTAGHALICGDALDVLRTIPSDTIDCVVTSPPYWRQRVYAGGGLGNEGNADDYIDALRAVFRQVHRVLNGSGSLWLNIDDTYHQKSMLGIPWRLALAMVEDSGWKIRNDVIWSKSGGSLNRSSDRLAHSHEHMFHLTKGDTYYYDADAVRLQPKQANVNEGHIKATTGLTLEICLKRIHNASALSEMEKVKAIDAVTETFDAIAAGRLHDFRLILRGENRVTHSDDSSISARAERIQNEGYAILRYNPLGTLPKDVWTLSPERSKGRDLHYAAYPEELCELPVKATTPPDGIGLDPFAGTGTTMVAAKKLGRRSIGIDLSQDYLDIAEQRLQRVTG